MSDVFADRIYSDVSSIVHLRWMDLSWALFARHADRLFVSTCSTCVSRLAGEPPTIMSSTVGLYIRIKMKIFKSPHDNILGIRCTSVDVMFMRLSGDMNGRGGCSELVPVVCPASKSISGTPTNARFSPAFFLPRTHSPVVRISTDLHCGVTTASLLRCDFLRVHGRQRTRLVANTIIIHTRYLVYVGR